MGSTSKLKKLKSLKKQLKKVENTDPSKIVNLQKRITLLEKSKN